MTVSQLAQKIYEEKRAAAPTTIYYAKKFLTGTLAGLTVNCQLAFPTAKQADAFAKGLRGKKGADAVTRDKYEVVDVSYQSFAR